MKDHHVACYFNGADGQKTAGIVGRIRGKWLSVEFLWVSEPHKGKRLGSELLSKLESYAKEQGCHSAMLQTASFQARPFYEKHGYTTQMVLDHFFTEEMAVYYMTKPLGASQSP